MVLNNTYREKLLNAILYFSNNVSKPTKIKIFKLLYFLDFEHFYQTGKSVTTLEYFAFERGPVPRTLYKEIENNDIPRDFQNHFEIEQIETKSGNLGNLFYSKHEPDLSVFSPREKKIMFKLANYYKDFNADDMSEESHLKNHPWDITIREKGENTRIDYKLVLDNNSKINPAWVTQINNEREEVLNNFRLKNRI